MVSRKGLSVNARRALDPRIMHHPHTADSLRQDLRNLGISASDTLFIHSSFKSLGPVAGGAGAVIHSDRSPSGFVLPSPECHRHKTER